MNIHDKIKKLIENERSTTHQILIILNELYLGRLFAELGYSSLFEYCTRELKYSSDQACRRISAAKLLRSIPSISKSIEAGELTVTHLSKAQTLFNQVDVNYNEKIDILKRLENTSNFEAEKIICAINPKKLTKEKIRPIETNLNEIKFFITDEQLSKLKRVKEENNKNNWQETIFFLCCDYLKKTEIEKEKKEKTNKAINSRYIPTAIKQKVQERAAGQCQFISAKGTRCNCRSKLEYAHIIPYAHGGLNTFDNIILYCKSHNLHDAITIFGIDKMNPFLNKMHHNQYAQT